MRVVSWTHLKVRQSWQFLHSGRFPKSMFFVLATMGSLSSMWFDIYIFIHLVARRFHERCQWHWVLFRSLSAIQFIFELSLEHSDWVPACMFLRSVCPDQFLTQKYQKMFICHRCLRFQQRDLGHRLLALRVCDSGSSELVWAKSGARYRASAIALLSLRGRESFLVPYQLFFTASYTFETVHIEKASSKALLRFHVVGSKSDFRGEMRPAYAKFSAHLEGSDPFSIDRSRPGKTNL